jgi:pyruvate/2-oxoglutarate dehydrogenase complex dihydrolipoamide dehydrogenase (E3) component
MGKVDYNIIVIGGGSAGLVSAYIASTVKAKVALSEKHKMGGDCLNTGCVPSKALIHSTKILSYIKRHREFGLKSASVEFNFSEIMEHIQSVVKKIEPHDSIKRYTNLGVDCIIGEAKILSPHEVKVNGNTLSSKNIILATGAHPSVPPILGLDQIDFLTTDNLWNIRELPKRLLIAGGGPIGSELAQCFNRLGSQVTQVELMSDILIREDGEFSRALRQRFVNEGIDVQINTKCKEVVIENGKQFMLCEKNGQDQRIEFDKVLIALGRTANSSGFGLESIGLEFGPSGTISVDSYLRTTKHKNIYACGDVVGPYQFTHIAAHQAWYCAVNALFSPFKKFKVDYSIIPWCTFTDPEIARVGLNEKEAKEQAIAYEVTRYEISELDRAITDGEDHGMVKVLTEPGKDRVLGVTIMSHHAGELITEYISAMKHGIGLNKILSTIHIYPTMAEANRFAAGIWKKNHAPKKLFKLAQKFHAWRRR